MKPNNFFFVAVVFAGKIGALAAPVKRNWAVNIHDGTLEIRDYALARRAVKENNELARSRPVGHYVKSTRCPYWTPQGCHYGPTWFTRPGSVDIHLIQNHEGKLPVGWVEPATVPVSKIRKCVRRYPVGETGQTTAVMNKVVHDHPQEAKRLQAERTNRGLYTAHIPGGPFPLPGMAHPAPLAATDTAAAEQMNALRLARNQQQNAKNAAKRAAAAADLGIVKRLKLQGLAEYQCRKAGPATKRAGAAIDLKLDQHLEVKRLARNRDKRAKRTAMHAAAATDLGITKHLALQRLAKKQHRIARNAAKRADAGTDLGLAKRLELQRLAHNQSHNTRRTPPLDTDPAGPLVATQHAASFG